MTESHVPEPIVALADARQRARDARDWPKADRLRAEIEAAGWRVVDQATSYRLTPARPPDVLEAERVLHGSSATVPSRLDDPRTGLATVVLVGADDAEDLARALGGLRAHAPRGTQVVVVADAPPNAVVDLLDAPEGPTAATIGDGIPEVVWLRPRAGRAAAANAGIRRAGASVVILLDTSTEVVGDVITPLLRALEDPAVAVAGGWGRTTSDLRHLTDAPSGDVDLVSGECLAFLVADYLERGPFDEHFRLPTHLDTWWSLVLRDGGDDRAARRAVAVDLPLVRHGRREDPTITATERARLEKRAFYRVFEPFGHRRDLLSGPRP